LIKFISIRNFLNGVSVLIIFVAGCAAPQQTPTTAKPPTAPPPEVVKAKKSPEQIRLEKMQEAEALALSGKTNDAFQAYMKLLAAWPTKKDIALRIIEITKKMDAPPPAPEGLRKQLVFAKTASDEAKDNAGYDRAISEYSKAVQMAPWISDIYINLGLLHEKRKNYEKAAGALQIFLDLSPNDPQKKLVQDKIYEMEFLAKDTVRKQEDIVKKRQACLSACSNITQPSVGIIRNQKHCEEIFGSWGYGLTPTRHRRQEECKNLVRNNEACKARC